MFSALALYSGAAWMGELRKSTIRDAIDRCERVAVPYRVAVPSPRDFQLQGRRPQVQEEPVLKEVAAQEGTTVPDVLFFFFIL